MLDTASAQGSSDLIIMSPAATAFHNVQAILDPSLESLLDLTIFVSCYNEHEYIVKTLETVSAALRETTRKFSYEIIIIDDCSQDGSANLIEEYIKSHPDQNLLLRRNARNLGWAQNYLDAAFIGRGKYYRVVCGDASEPKPTMLRVFSAIGEADILVPYYAESEGRSLYRRVFSTAYTTLVNLLSGFKLRYYNGLHVHLRHNVLRWHSNTRGFGFQADILCLLLERGFTYKEVPVATVELKKGDSTALNFKNLLSVSHTLFDIFVRRVANWIYLREARKKAEARRAAKSQG